MGIISAISTLMEEVDTLGEWHTYALTPPAVNAPAVFPGAVESIKNQTQDGTRVGVVSVWIIYAAHNAESQHDLYSGAEAVWDHLDGVATAVNGRVIELTDIGEVEVSGINYWGGRLRVELYV